MIIEEIKNLYQNNPDLTIRKAGLVTLIYFETICSSNKINDYFFLNEKMSNNILKKGPNTTKIKKSEIPYYLSNGYVVIIKNKSIYVMEVKEDLSRSVSTPETQIAINGPKDAFTENYNTNLGLIRRRIKSPNLKIINQDVGRITKTKVGIIYLDNICNQSLVDEVAKIIQNIDIDGIIDSSNISDFLENYDGKMYAPSILKYERPDYVCNALLDGKLAIIVDNSPFLLVLPAFLIDFINPPIDKYSKAIGVKHLKMLRILCFIITLILPAIYIALTCYNQESIPTGLLLNFAKERAGVPFSSIVEAFMMLLIYEILRESDIRFPTSYGSANSILGALILGEASVEAGIVSPIMIIVIALSFISSLIFTDIDFINAIRHYRYFFLISSSLFGLFGLFLAIIYFLTKLNKEKSLHYLYAYPFVEKGPYYENYVKALPSPKQFFRTKLLALKNIIKER